MVFKRLQHYIQRTLLAVCLLGAWGTVYSQSNYEYRLGVGDEIAIIVYEEDDLSFETKVNQTGTFAFPYLADLYLIGKTTDEVAKEIHQGLLGRVLIHPNVSVSILNYRDFSIGGEVESPGSYSYEPGLTVKKAINLAGGLSDWGSGSRFSLEREIDIPNEKLSSESLIFPGDVLTILPRRF